MKKLLIGILVISLLFTICACSKERTDISDYQYMYDGIVKDWNKQASSDVKRKSLLGFGEYLYNSQLILFPRETPSTLNEFYFHWTPGIDVDGYAIYFTCELDENNYAAFVNGLENFEVSNGTVTTKLLYESERFSFPTYIAQWNNVEEKWEVLEYIMLDEANRTVIFVYTMSELDIIEEHSFYNVTPTELHFLEDDFSIYKDFDNCTYDVSFLDYLN